MLPLPVPSSLGVRENHEDNVQNLVPSRQFSSLRIVQQDTENNSSRLRRTPPRSPYDWKIALSAYKAHPRAFQMEDRLSPCRCRPHLAIPFRVHLLRLFQHAPGLFAHLINDLVILSLPSFHFYYFFTIAILRPASTLYLSFSTLPIIPPNLRLNIPSPLHRRLILAICAPPSNTSNSM